MAIAGEALDAVRRRLNGREELPRIGGEGLEALLSPIIAVRAPSRSNPRFARRPGPPVPQVCGLSGAHGDIWFMRNRVLGERHI